MDFKDYLKTRAQEIDGEVEKILNDEIVVAGKIDPKLTNLLKSFAGFCQGGKRIRGTLVKLGYELADSSFIIHHSSFITKIAAAYEIFHAGLLIHDDIIDKSKYRRNKLALHKITGIPQAITLGDYGIFLSFSILAGTNAASLFSQIMKKTAWGQLLDVEKADAQMVMRLKTAVYSIAGPLQIGALTGGADQNLINLLGDFGEKLGIAFQIKDDILDKDLGLEAVNEAETYKNQALELLSKITKDSKMSKLLEQMAEYLIERTE